MSFVNVIWVDLNSMKFILLRVQYFPNYYRFWKLLCKNIPASQLRCRWLDKSDPGLFRNRSLFLFPSIPASSPAFRERSHFALNLPSDLLPLWGLLDAFMFLFILFLYFLSYTFPCYRFWCNIYFKKEYYFISKNETFSGGQKSGFWTGVNNKPF